MFTAASQYGVQPQAPSPGAAQALEPAAISRDDRSLTRSMIDPHNPLVILGGLMALTVGLIGASGSVRLGRASFQASAGKG